MDLTEWSISHDDFSASVGLSEKVVPVLKMIQLGLIETSTFTHFKDWVKQYEMIKLMTSMARSINEVEAVEAIASEFKVISERLKIEEKKFLEEQRKQHWDDY